MSRGNGRLVDTLQTGWAEPNRIEVWDPWVTSCLQPSILRGTPGDWHKIKQK